MNEEGKLKGITAVGIYLPYYRLKRETIFEAMGWFNPGIAALAIGERKRRYCEWGIKSRLEYQDC